MTALDVWLFLCMNVVAFALFEYAMLLAIRFGKQNEIRRSISGDKDEPVVVGKCLKIDHYALRGFLVYYAVLLGAYITWVKVSD